MVYIGLHWYPQSVHPIPYGRGKGQMFGHTNVQLNEMLYDCPYGGRTEWYDAEEYLAYCPPFLSVHLRHEDPLWVASLGLISGEQYSLRGLAREVKDGLYPQSVNCVYGGRKVLRNLGVESYARTPDEFLGEALYLTQTVRADVSYSQGFRERCVEVRAEGWRVDSVFNREG